jgi:hypothetical protein
MLDYLLFVADSYNSDADTPLCFNCKKAIREGKVCTSNTSHVFHSSCFVCSQCGVSLARSQAFEHVTGELYCKDHFDALVSEEDPSSASNLSCSVCLKQLQDPITFKGQLYCPQHSPDPSLCAGWYARKHCCLLFVGCLLVVCWLFVVCLLFVCCLFVVVCCFCCVCCCCLFFSSPLLFCSGKALTRQVVAALDRKWHSACFVCEECKKPFEGGLFFKVDGKPFCSEHAMDDEDEEEGSLETGETTDDG